MRRLWSRGCRLRWNVDVEGAAELWKRGGLVADEVEYVLFSIVIGLGLELRQNKYVRDLIIFDLGCELGRGSTFVLRSDRVECAAEFGNGDVLVIDVDRQVIECELNLIGLKLGIECGR